MPTELKGMFKQPYVSMFESAYTFDECRFALFGVPFDGTSTYRRGSRHAPMELRRVSRNIETYSLRFQTDVEEIPLCDMGDLTKLGDAEEVVKAVSDVCREVNQAGKVPVAVGGEHTLTLGAASALKPDAVVCMDAHLDMRDEYM